MRDCNCHSVKTGSLLFMVSNEAERTGSVFMMTGVCNFWFSWQKSDNVL